MAAFLVITIAILSAALLFDVLALVFAKDKDVASGVGVAMLHLPPLILGIVACSIALVNAS
jgi:hypothetical protein